MRDGLFSSVVLEVLEMCVSHMIQELFPQNDPSSGFREFNEFTSPEAHSHDNEPFCV